MSHGSSGRRAGDRMRPIFRDSCTSIIPFIAPNCSVLQPLSAQAEIMAAAREQLRQHAAAMEALLARVTQAPVAAAAGSDPVSAEAGAQEAIHADIAAAQLAAANSRAEEAEALALAERTRREAAEAAAAGQSAAAAEARGEAQQARGEAQRAQEEAALARTALKEAQDECERVRNAAKAQIDEAVASAVKREARDQSAALAVTGSSAGKRKARDQSAAPAATGTSSGQQQQKEAGLQNEPRRTMKSALSVPFEKSMERISVAGDGSCGFWCWLAFFGLCKHAVVRTLQEDKRDKNIKRKLEEASFRRAFFRGAPPPRECTIKGKLEPPMSDYMLLQQLVTHMQQDDDTWDRLRDKPWGEKSLTDAARKVQAASPSCPNVDSSSYMDAHVHLPYLAVKLGMPVYCAEVMPGTEDFAHVRFDASGGMTYLETEAAMLAEMNGFQPTPLFQCPPLFKLVDEHWSLHLPQGTFEKTYSDKRLKASKASWFNELFALSELE